MSALVGTSKAHSAGRPISTSQIFFAMLRRDMRVARRELPFFLLRTTMQPLMLMVVFGYLLPKLGMMQGNYTTTLLPGVLALSIALSAVQSIALPMVAQFGFSREIEDRLLAPIPVRLVAAELVVAATLQGILAGLVVLPAGRLIMGPIPGLELANIFQVLAVTTIGAAAFSALGLFLGCAIQPQQIGLLFSTIVGPMIFLGVRTIHGQRSRRCRSSSTPCWSIPSCMWQRDCAGRSRPACHIWTRWSSLARSWCCWQCFGRWDCAASCVARLGRPTFRERRLKVRALLLLAVLSVFTATSAGAQSGSVTVRQMQAVTDSTGRCRVPGVPLRKQIVKVKRLGFSPLSAELTFTNTDTTETETSSTLAVRAKCCSTSTRSRRIRSRPSSTIAARRTSRSSSMSPAAGSRVASS